MKKLLLALTVIGAHAHAANWVKVAGQWEIDGSEQFVFQVDTDSLQKRDGYAQAWVRQSSGKAEKLEGSYPEITYQSILNLQHYDCKHGEVAASRQIVYSLPFGQGEIVHSRSWERSKLKDRMESPIPGTYGESILRAVCSFKIKN